MASTCPRHGQQALSTSALQDLRWFYCILQNPLRFNSIPVVHFADDSTPQYHVYMDASGEGLCVLEPSIKCYIRQRFSADDIRDLSINIREFRSAVLAALCWGPYWFESTDVRTHVQFHIDNTSAVTWANRRTSRNPVAQLYNRLLSLAEFQYNLVITAEHISGKLNVMADAGSRAWDSTHPLANIWSNMSCSWQQIQIEEPFNDLSVVWDQCCVERPWQTLPLPRTHDIGANGADSHTGWAGQGGSQLPQLQTDSDTSRLTAGPKAGTPEAPAINIPRSS